jgi:DNA helicase-2/ATP-dependent DNA helicase PcrA
LELRANFENSRFANLKPDFVEQPIEIELAGLIVVCKIDAIFAEADGFLIVDWKSGSAPKSEADLRSRAIQLALYRIAFAKWQGIGLERVSAAFFFAADGAEVRPERLMSEQELVVAIEEARTARRG